MDLNWQERHADGEMALPLIMKCKPDLLITDIKMPFMDGLTLCKL